MALVTTPAQLAPLASGTRDAPLTPDELTDLSNFLAGALSQTNGDDRTFTATLSTVGSGALRLAARCTEAALPCGTALAKSYRGYMVRHLNEARCSDNLEDSQSKLPQDVEQFNRFVEQFSFEGVPPITPEEIKPSKVEEASEDLPYWTTPIARDVLVKLKHLRFGGTKTPLSAGERAKAEWLGEFDEALQTISTWKSSDEKSPSDYLHQKAVAFKALTDLAPTDERKLHMMTRNAEFLAQSYSDDRRDEWFVHANHAVREASKATGPEREKLLSVLRHSGNAILSLYATYLAGCESK